MSSRRWDDRALIAALASLPEDLIPSAPDIAARVVANLQAQPAADLAPSRWASGRLRPALAGVAALIVVLGAGLVVSPGLRDAVAGWLGVDGVRIETVPQRPSASAGLPGDLSELDLGDEVTLTAAREAVSFELLVPGEPVPPAAKVFLDRTVPGGMVTLVYDPGPLFPAVPGPRVAGRETGFGLLLSQFQGRVSEDLFGKLTFEGVDVRPVEVAGAKGFFLSDEPHFFFYLGPDGKVREDTIRLATNTLLWSKDGVTYRLESNLGLEAAVELAASLR